MGRERETSNNNSSLFWTSYCFNVNIKLFTKRMLQIGCGALGFSYFVATICSILFGISYVVGKQLPGQDQ